MRSYYQFVGSIIIIGLIISCKNKTAEGANNSVDTLTPRPANIDISIPGGFSDQTVLRFDSTNLATFLREYSEFREYRDELTSFYRKRNYSYAWFDKNGLIEQAGNLYNRVMNITEEGVPNKVPYRDSFAIVMDSLFAQENLKAAPEPELFLSAQYFAYAQNAWQGLSEKESKSIDWNLPRKKLDAAEIMDAILSDTVKRLVEGDPVYRQYRLLKPYLKEYRDMEAKGGWKEIKPDKKKYEKGDTSTVIRLIKERLFLLGDLASTDTGAVYDNELENGIKSFQHRLGLKEDGVIGPDFFKELNYPISKRIEQIIVNMERCRWLPEAPNKDFLVVNIPAFSLHAYRGDSLLWTMNVIVGKAIHKTAIFSGELKYVVFSPYWNIPSGIMKNEIQPAIRRNPNYVKQHNMEWVGNSLRQKPGPSNPLGLVKFLFPNSYSIYLHDTPSKGLFEQDKRTFSHGCIRVSRAKDLAKWLLRDYPEWTDEKITQAMNAGKEQYFTLKETVPVFIAYFTAWVDRQGKLNFRDDVYDRDDRLAEMMMK